MRSRDAALAIRRDDRCGAIASLVIGAFVARMRTRGGLDQGLSRPLFIASMTFGGVTVLIEIAGTADVVPARVAYFVGLFYLQYLMATLFYRMVQMADEAVRNAARR